MAKRGRRAFKMPSRSREGAKATPLDLRFARQLFADGNALARDLALIAAGKIQRIAVEAGRLIGREATDRLLRLFARPEALLDPASTLSTAVELIRTYGRLAARGLAESSFAAEAGSAGLVVGLAGVIGRPSSPPPILPPAEFVSASITGPPVVEFPVIDEAVRSLQESQVMTAGDFYDLSRETREDAFTITADLAEGDLEKVRQILEENVRDKTSREDFMRTARDQVESLGISESHLEQVFRNNVNDRYSNGVERVLKNDLVEDQFPYRAYYAIRDDRVRDEHLQMESLGIGGSNIYHKDDPVWQLFRPPWDWNCRCGFTPLSVRQAARRGVVEAIQWLEAGIEPVHEFVRMPDFEPSPSWQRVRARA